MIYWIILTHNGISKYKRNESQKNFFLKIRHSTENVVLFPGVDPSKLKQFKIGIN